MFFRYMMIHFNLTDEKEFNEIEIKNFSIEDVKRIKLEDIHAFISYLAVYIKVNLQQEQEK